MTALGFAASLVLATLGRALLGWRAVAMRGFGLGVVNTPLIFRVPFAGRAKVFGDLIVRQVCRKRRALVSKDGDAPSVDVAPETVRLKDCSDRVL